MIKLSNGIKTDEFTDEKRGNYVNYKKTYLNKLFFLMKKYAMRGIILSPKMMSLLTSPRLRRLKLHWLLYGITKMKLNVIRVTSVTSLLYNV